MFVQNIKQIIHQFNGSTYWSAGVVNGFFSAPAEAARCAERLRQMDLNVEVYGTQIQVHR